MQQEVWYNDSFDLYLSRTGVVINTHACALGALKSRLYTYLAQDVDSHVQAPDKYF